MEEKRLNLKNRFKTNKTISRLEELRIILPNYKPQEKQLSFHKAEQRQKGIKGGYGSGKTYAFCAEAILLAYVNRPVPVVISYPTEDSAIASGLPVLKSLCKDNDIEFNWTKDSGSFEMTFGSNESDIGKIILIGQKFFKGVTVAAIGMDEPFSQRKETYENLIARARSGNAKRQEIFWAGTPEPETMEWGFEFFAQDHNDKDLFTITVPTYENKYLSKGYLKSLENTFDAKTKEVYMLGKYMSLSQGKVYYGFERTKNVLLVDDIPLTGTIQLIISFDFNVDPMTATEFILHKNRYFQVDEYLIHSSNTDELCESIITNLENKYDIQDLSIIITGDASGRSKKSSSFGKSDYMIIKDWFLRSRIKFTLAVPNENPPVRDRVNYTNKLFEQKKFFICENCKFSIRDRELVGWKRTSSNMEGFHIDKSRKDLSHLSDAGDYALWNTRVLCVDEDERTPMIVTGRREKKY
ncbi:MAG: hypothetical protein HGGPFJEG_01371 [Ignavibacteria bacterium]|nr:hypothetical protein [Ignavibacteria bacterium]